MENRSKDTHRSQHEETTRKRKQQPWLTVIGIGLFLAFLIYFTWQETGGSGGLRAEEVTDPAIGSIDAPVVITEYADFGCPSCRTWHNFGIREQILAAFGDQVRFVWKDLPVITPQSPQAAEAGHCASAQGKFWEFHDLIYEHFGGLDENALYGYATRVGLDMDPFQQCLTQGLMRNKVQANEQEARRLGLRGTPGFAINGRPLPAPPSFEQLGVLIQQELSAQ